MAAEDNEMMAPEQWAIDTTDTAEADLGDVPWNDEEMASDNKDALATSDEEFLDEIAPSEEVRAPRSRKPYREATANPMSRSAAVLSETDLFGFDEIITKEPFSDTMVTQEEIRTKLKGSNGLKVISTFTGCGGSDTGFSWAGWDTIMAVEFVTAARETLNSNYDSYLIEPEPLLAEARKIAKDMGVELVEEKQRTVRKRVIPASLNWAETLSKLTDEQQDELRYRVTKFGLQQGEGMAIFGDDIRGLSPRAVMEHLNIKEGELDCLEGSPPCFPAGTMVLCQDRIRPIEEVEIGHVVLTHKGRWRKVVNTMTRRSDTVILDGGRIESTPDHPFYARTWNDVRAQKNSLNAPEWIHAENMEGNFYSVPVSVEMTDLPEMPSDYSKFEDPEDFWYFIGRWLGDGWMRHNVDYTDTDWAARPKRGDLLSLESRDCLNGCGNEAARHTREGREHYFTLFCSRKCQAELNARERIAAGYPGGSRGEMMLCSSFEEHDDLYQFLSERTPWNWSAWVHNSVWKYRFASIEMARWVYKHFGKGAQNKTLPGWALTLPESQRRALLQGYLDADGLKTLPEHKERYNTVSRGLAVGFRILASTLNYATSWRTDIFQVGADGGPGWADGREVHARPQYAVNLTRLDDVNESRYTVDEFGLRWQKMRGATTEGRTNIEVFDITVEEDHSFVADGYVVHNCKSFSTAGLRERGWGSVLHYSDERHQQTDDLFQEFLRLLMEFKPRSFVAENVTGIGMGEAERKVLVPLMQAFDELGYSAEARSVNSREYGVPQSRPRMFFVGIRKDHLNKRGKRVLPSFPEKSVTSYTLGDALEHARDQNTPQMLAEANLEGKEIGKIWHKLPQGGSPKEKAYQMMRCREDAPAPTITATSAGNMAAAGPCHPTECRKFTVPEYRAIFTFPKDYVFTGTTEQQGERMGRSVPPMMMKKIAESVANTLMSSTIGEMPTES